MNRQLTRIAALGVAYIVGAAGASVTTARGEIPAAWVGRYQAQVVSATSGKEGDAVAPFGRGCRRYADAAGPGLRAEPRWTSAAAGDHRPRPHRIRLPGQCRQPDDDDGAGGARHGSAGGGTRLNLRTANGSATGTYRPGRPTARSRSTGCPASRWTLLNNGRWEKHRPWSVLPPPDKSKMRGPFVMKFSGGGQASPPAIHVDQQLQLDDALIEGALQAFIVRSDADITPQCQAAVPAAPKCAASEYPEDQGHDRRRRHPPSSRRAT